MAFNDEMVENFGRELPANYDFAAERDYEEMTDAFEAMESDDCLWCDDEPQDFRDDVEADADVLRSAGWGTDEDYGYDGYYDGECDLYGEC